MMLQKCVWYYEQYCLFLHQLTVYEKENDHYTGFCTYHKIIQIHSILQQTLRLTVSKATNVTLDVFNTIGEKVATLVNGQ